MLLIWLVVTGTSDARYRDALPRTYHQHEDIAEVASNQVNRLQLGNDHSYIPIVFGNFFIQILRFTRPPPFPLAIPAVLYLVIHFSPTPQTRSFPSSQPPSYLFLQHRSLHSKWLLCRCQFSFLTFALAPFNRSRSVLSRL